MKNTILLNHEERLIVMDRTFYKNSTNARFEEYTILQRIRHDYPTYTPAVKRIKYNHSKETYKGLTYSYMENYIQTHESVDTVEETMAEYRELRLISECHGKARRYPTIKKWFLKKYPAIEQFGKEPEEQSEERTTNYEVVMPPLEKVS